jgi:hypothetical protein
MSLIQITIDNHVLTYQVVDSALSRSWLSMMLAIGGPVPLWRSVNELHIRTPESQQLSQARLAEIVDRMGVRYRDLNDLHLQFQTACEQGQWTDDWAEINLLVHDLESRIHPRSATAKFYVDYDRELEPIDPELRDHWAHRAVSGDLCMGYHTIGKTLWHACHDDDPDVVRADQLRPQLTLNPELLLYWGHTLPLTNQVKHQQIRDWLAHNHLAAQVDLTDPVNQYHGEPLLARQLDPDPDSVLAWIKPWSQIQQFHIIPLL